MSASSGDSHDLESPGMVDVSLGWKVLKMPFFLLGFLSTLKRSDTLKGYLKDKRTSSHDFMFPMGKSDYF